MAAGQGFKTFANGDILTAADVNGYLMQGVLVFATTAARDAAITSPQQGQVALTKDTNTIWKYTGSAWTNIDTSGTMPLTTKGDIFGYDTAAARIPVGTNGQVLTADSTQALGVKWGTVSAGANWNLVNAGGTALTGAATITVSGISGADKIMVLITGGGAGAGDLVGIRFNGDTATNYYVNGFSTEWPSTYSTNSAQNWGTNLNNIRLFYLSSNTASIGSANLLVTGCNSSGVKVFQGSGGANANGGNGQAQFSVGGYYNSSSVITSVSAFATGNFDAGTLYVYTSA